MRLLANFRKFATLAALNAWLTMRGASEYNVPSFVSGGKRIASRAWVAGALEYVSPQSRTAGGYAVIASVDGPNTVTVNAGYTLGTGGRCRLWDKSAGVHLDDGGVEWSRSGLVVTLPTTAGLAATDVIYSDRLEFNEYSHCIALETALGTSFNGELRLLNRTTGAVILRRVVRSGAWVSVEVNFAAVTATPNAVAASVAGSVITVSAGHTITTLAKTLRVWNTTDGALIADEASGAWSVSGDDVTMGAATAAAVAAALGAGKTVRLWAEGVSELCIGASPCALQPGAGGVAYFSGSGIVWPAQTSETVLGCLSGRRYTLSWPAGAVALGAAAGDYVGLGHRLAAAFTFAGYRRLLDSSVKMGLSRSSTNVETTVVTIATEGGIGVIFGGGAQPLINALSDTTTGAQAGTGQSTVAAVMTNPTIALRNSGITLTSVVCA